MGDEGNADDIPAVEHDRSIRIGADPVK
jgi:hypothetical protein